jgi:uridylate kinase
MTRVDTIVLKLSGEALAHHRPLDGQAFEEVAGQIVELVQSGVRCGVVVGGGNIFRGNLAWGTRDLPGDSKDELGMLATALNATALHHQLSSVGITSTVIAKPGPCEHLGSPWASDTFDRGDADVFIVAGGTGCPGVSSDVAAPMLARDMGASKIVMSKNGVDAIYTGDPHDSLRTPHGPRPSRLASVATADALRANLRFMDRAAIELCEKYGLHVHVVGAAVPRSLVRAYAGERLGSLLHPSTIASRRPSIVETSLAS